MVLPAPILDVNSTVHVMVAVQSRGCKTVGWLQATLCVLDQYPLFSAKLELSYSTIGVKNIEDNLGLQESAIAGPSTWAGENSPRKLPSGAKGLQMYLPSNR